MKRLAEAREAREEPGPQAREAREEPAGGSSELPTLGARSIGLKTAFKTPFI